MTTAADATKTIELIGIDVARPMAVPAAGACPVFVIVMNRITTESEAPSLYMSYPLIAGYGVGHQ